MNTITINQAIAIKNIINTMDDSVELFPAYSGRFMFGAECVGYSVHSVATVGMAVAQVLMGTDIDVAEVLSDSRTDDMGKQTIVYFPLLQVVTSETVWVETVEAIDAQDWEVPGIEYDGDNDDNEDNIIEAFEAHNGISLDGEALKYLKDSMRDFYCTY